MRKSLLPFVMMLGVALAGAQSSKDYVLGPEDVITVSVLKHPEFSGDFLVPPGGIIDFPAVGKLKVTGLAVGELAQTLTGKLKARLLKPEVSVSLKIARTQRIYVSGDVRTPGTLDLKPGWRLSEVLAAAGGLVPGSDPNDVTVSILRAENGSTESVKASEILLGDPQKNLVVRVGDVVSFKSIELMPVYVVGKVRTPGLYRLRKDNPGVLEAITLAGGFGDTPATGSVSITHLNGEVETVDLSPVVLRGEHPPLPKLRPGDLVVVPEAQGKVALLGLVRAPGFYPLQDGKTLTLSEALALAQGTASNRARLSKVAIVRVENGTQKRLVYDLGRYLSKGDGTQNPLLRPGDVVYFPETNSIDWSIILNSLSTTALLGNALRR